MKKTLRSITAILIAPFIFGIVIPVFLLMDWLLEDKPDYQITFDAITAWQKFFRGGGVF